MNKIRQIVSLADLTYQGAARLPEHGLPLGNGRMGSLIWLTPNAIHLQINRCDVFGMNSSSRSVGITDSDFSCGCAFADIEFGSMRIRFSTKIPFPVFPSMKGKLQSPEMAFWFDAVPI